MQESLDINYLMAWPLIQVEFNYVLKDDTLLRLTLTSCIGLISRSSRRDGDIISLVAFWIYIGTFK